MGQTHATGVKMNSAKRKDEILDPVVEGPEGPVTVWGSERITSSCDTVQT